MADHAHMHDEHCAVQSRVSWGAILAGAVVSLACYMVLTLLGGAIGLSAADANFNTDGLSTGAGIWAVLTTIISLFVGGWVASQAVVGETKGEAVMHSIIMWGVVMGMILCLVAAGARAGFSAMVGYSQFADNMGQGGVSAQTQQRIDNAAASAQQNLSNPDNREAMRQRAAQATWWALLGTLLSIAAAVGGGYVGGGTSYRWLSHGTHRHGTGSMATGMGT